MFNFFKKTDNQIRQDVIDELQWDPTISATQLSVTADDGVITLRGTVPHYFEKTAAEEATERVGGVRAVANEIEVKLLSQYQRSDGDIAKAALDALKWDYRVPDGVQVSVTNGWVTLRGEAEWDFERNAARKAVLSLMGVSGVSNEITITSKIRPTEVKSLIEEALKRSAESEGRKISVTASGNHVVLSGNVHSFSEKEDASLAAWSAPGVMNVENNLKIAA